MSRLIDALNATVVKWRAGNQDRRGGVVLVWDGQVYGWKNCLRDAIHERPGAYAVDEDGHVFVAEGGDEYNGAKCWVVVDLDATEAQEVMR
ncbi:antirestriction protein ArdR [Pseudomonas sp. RT6P73]